MANVQWGNGFAHDPMKAPINISDRFMWFSCLYPTAGQPLSYKETFKMVSFNPRWEIIVNVCKAYIRGYFSGPNNIIFCWVEAIWPAAGWIGEVDPAIWPAAGCITELDPAIWAAACCITELDPAIWPAACCITELDPAIWPAASCITELDPAFDQQLVVYQLDPAIWPAACCIT